MRAAERLKQDTVRTPACRAPTSNPRLGLPGQLAGPTHPLEQDAEREHRHREQRQKDEHPWISDSERIGAPYARARKAHP